MDKGVSTAQNIALLRYARSLKMGVFWSLLYEVPGDRLEEFEMTLSLLPLLRHLFPPMCVGPITINRFSRYFERAENYGISDLRPPDEYSDVFPPDADLLKFAYDFRGEYQSASRENPDIVSRIRRETELWRELWRRRETEPPLLHVSRLGNNLYRIRDTRGIPGTRESHLLDRDQVSAALTSAWPLQAPATEWALKYKVGVEIDGRYVPLAIAQPDMFADFEDEPSRS